MSWVFSFGAIARKGKGHAAPQPVRRAILDCVRSGRFAPGGCERGAAQHAGQPIAIVRVSEEIDLDDVGNATGQSELVLPLEVYQKLKSLMSPRYNVVENGQQVVKTKPPKVDNVLHSWASSAPRTKCRTSKGSSTTRQPRSTSRTAFWAGCSYNQGHWSFSFASDPDTKVEVHKSDLHGDSATVELHTRQQGIQLISRLKLNLPAGATKAEIRKKSLELVYSLPPPANSDDKQAQRPELRLDIKPQIMSAIYKLYGNPKWIELWAARSVFQNDTAETLSDFRARFHIDGYSAWTTWKRTGKVFPGQTVVDAFYPIIDGKLRSSKGARRPKSISNTNTSRPNGEKVTETEVAEHQDSGDERGALVKSRDNADSTWYDIFRNGPMVLASFTSATIR